MITDAHNHLHWLTETDLAVYGIDRCITCGTSPDDWPAVLELARRQPGVIPAVGVHPWYIDETPHGELLKLYDILEENPEVAVGEVGLDKTDAAPAMERQREVLRFHIDLARQFERLIVLHCVRAYGTLLQELGDSNLASPVIIHDYRGSVEMIQRFSALPFPVYFSVSKPDLIAEISFDRLLVESDASPDNGRSPAYAADFYEVFDVDADQVAANFSDVTGTPL